MNNEVERMLDEYETGRVSRRHLITCLTGLAAAAGIAPRLSAAQDPGTGATIEDPSERPASSQTDATFVGVNLNHLALTVTDVNRSRDFYIRHLGMTVATQGPRNCFLRCAENDFVALFQGEKAEMNHYCYSVRAYDAATAVKKLTAEGLKPRRSGDRVYFDDPDGLEVQVAAKEHGV